MLLENSPNLKGVRILVVDDDRDTLELLEFLFEHYGAQVRTAATASEVLEVLTQWQPEILLSDIAMPSLDGYTLIRMLRAMPSEFGGQIPAIALTAYAVETDHQQMLLKAGFQKHIAKPVDLTELATVIANVVRQNIGHKNSELS